MSGRRRDRTGELVDDDDDDGDHRCAGGWLGDPAEDDRPRPCSVCRPWAAASPPRPPTRDELDALTRRGVVVPRHYRPRRRSVSLPARMMSR